MSEWLKDNHYSSSKHFKFSKQLEIVQVDGPLQDYLWRHRGFQVRVMTAQYNVIIDGVTRDVWFYTYVQNYESWFHAAVRATYYRLYSYYHNFVWRKHHRRQ